MITQDCFRGHYDEWNQRRVAFLESRFGRPWFAGKRVLELGCGYAHIGRALAQWGARVVAVDGREAHLQVVKQNAPHIETVLADLNHDWPVQGRFDLILNLGLIYHLEQLEAVLERCFECSDRMVLETEVLDTLEDTCLAVSEDCALYDQSLTGGGVRPSAAYLERLFDAAGFYAHRLTTDVCNTTGDALNHVYDWPCTQSQQWQHGKRRLWVLQRKSTVPAPCSGNISVVVQGPVVGLNHHKPRRRITQRCLAHVRTALPDAEIILSTWQGTTTDGMDFDRLVESEDPGATVCDDVYQVRNNVNRQIISTRAGIAQVSRPYCLKLRTDLMLGSDDFLRHWAAYPLRQWSYKFSTERMLASAVFSRRFAGVKHRTTRLAFHPGDLLFFGFAEDLATLFNVPLTVEPENSRWFESRDEDQSVFDCYAHSLCRFFPEQHLWLEYVRQFIDINWRDRLDLNSPDLIHDLPSQLNNLVMLDQSQWCYELPKYLLRQYVLPSFDWRGLYRHDIWRQDYHQWCGGPALAERTYDSRMRRLFVDNPPTKVLNFVAPRLVNYLHKKVRKQQLWR